MHLTASSRDVLHPNRPNVSKEELREKLAQLYKASKDQVNCFGFRTQYGGGKSTGFALIYDSNESMKKFEPHYRLVRVGMANKIEKASRQQRTYNWILRAGPAMEGHMLTDLGVQASSARTGPRSSGVRPRPRAARRTRNKRIAVDGDVGENGLFASRSWRDDGWQGLRVHHYTPGPRAAWEKTRRLLCLLIRHGIAYQWILIHGYESRPCIRPSINVRFRHIESVMFWQKAYGQGDKVADKRRHSGIRPVHLSHPTTLLCL